MPLVLICGCNYTERKHIERERETERVAVVVVVVNGNLYLLVPLQFSPSFSASFAPMPSPSPSPPIPLPLLSSPLFPKPQKAPNPSPRLFRRPQLQTPLQVQGLLLLTIACCFWFHSFIQFDQNLVFSLNSLRLVFEFVWFSSSQSNKLIVN